MAGPDRIVIFAVLLAMVFGGALALGAAVDPDVGGSRSVAEHSEAIRDASQH